jgi:hypothetical protein
VAALPVDVAIAVADGVRVDAGERD